MDNKQLKELASGIIFSGMLSEFHIKNLSNYPFIFFDGVDLVEIETDIPNHEEFTAGKKPKITYKVTFKKKAKITYIDKRIDAVVNSVKTLLWPDTEVLVLDKNSNLELLKEYGPKRRKSKKTAGSRKKRSSSKSRK